MYLSFYVKSVCEEGAEWVMGAKPPKLQARCSMEHPLLLPNTALKERSPLPLGAQLSLL